MCACSAQQLQGAVMHTDCQSKHSHGMQLRRGWCDCVCGLSSGMLHCYSPCCYFAPLPVLPGVSGPSCHGAQPVTRPWNSSCICWWGGGGDLHCHTPRHPPACAVLQQRPWQPPAADRGAGDGGGAQCGTGSQQVGLPCVHLQAVRTQQLSAKQHRSSCCRAIPGAVSYVPRLSLPSGWTLAPPTWVCRCSATCA
jgi:hypothetical protein